MFLFIMSIDNSNVEFVEGRVRHPGEVTEEYSIYKKYELGQ